MFTIHSSVLKQVLIIIIWFVCYFYFSARCLPSVCANKGVCANKAGSRLLRSFTVQRAAGYTAHLLRSRFRLTHSSSPLNSSSLFVASKKDA